MLHYSVVSELGLALERVGGGSNTPYASLACLACCLGVMTSGEQHKLPNDLRLPKEVTAVPVLAAGSPIVSVEGVRTGTLSRHCNLPLKRLLTAIKSSTGSNSKREEAP